MKSYLLVKVIVLAIVQTNQGNAYFIAMSKKYKQISNTVNIFISSKVSLFNNV